MQIGCRVSINSFKNKNQEGIIKFIGEVKGKLGEWVGIELEEAKGDMDGTNNGVFLFQCNPGCGLLLRATQLKVIAPPAANTQELHKPPLIDVDYVEVSETPLLTPKDPPPDFQKKLAQTVTQSTLQQLQKIADDQEGKPTEGKALGWKERLEKLREQKAKKATEEEKKVETDPEKDKIKEMFAPATGIKRTGEGKIEVDKEVVKAAVKNTEETPVVVEQEEAKKLTSKLGSGLSKGLKGPSHMKAPSTSVLPVPTQQLTSRMSDAAKELKNKNDQIKEKLAARQVSPTKTASARNASPTKAATGKVPVKKPVEAEKPKADTTLASKIGMKKLNTALATATADKAQRPATARGKEEEKTKKPIVKDVTKKKSQATADIVQEDVKLEDENLLLDDLQDLKQTSPSPIRKTPPAQQQSIDTFSGVSQVEYKKLEASLRKKNDESYSLQIEVRELSSKIESLQEQHKQKLDELQSHYDDKLSELQQQLNDNSVLSNQEQKAKQRESELLAQIAQIQQEKQEALVTINQYKQQIEDQEKEKLRLTQEIEAKNVDIESIQLELELLKDEKEELLTLLKQSSEIQHDDMDSLTQDEIKTQNQKLRQAITTLTMNFEMEKNKQESRIQELEEKTKLVDEYEKKLEDMDLLIEEVDLKEKERLDMEKKLEEFFEYEQMVEEMTQELLKKEEENEELLQKIIELEEMNNIAEELNENQEQYVKELNIEIADRDAQISNLDMNQKQLEELVLDIEGQMNKYKEKCQELKQKCKMLDEELQQSYASSDQKVKISTLIEKQNQLIMKLREANKKDLELNNFQIEYWQEKMKAKLMLEFLPQKLYEDIKLESIEKIQLLNKARNKAMLLIREICEKQILNVDSLHDDQDQRQNFTRILITIAEEAIKLIDISNKIMLCIHKMSIEKYDEATKLLSWNKYVAICQFIDKLLGLLKEESLSVKFDISIFVQAIKSLQDLQANIEYKYIEKTTEDENSNNQQSPTKRQKELKKSNKFTLRNEMLKMAMGVIVLASIAGAHNDDIRTKSKLIYWRLIDIILKIDYIEGSEQGEEYLNLEELSLDTRLSQKYNTLRILWTAMDEAGDSMEKDWSSVLEAIERDITSLMNDYKFKKLINKYNDEVKEQKLDDLYQLGYNSKGPWTLISKKIRQDLEEVAQMKEKIEQLVEKQKEQTKQYLLLKREKDEVSVVNQALEKRLGDAISKAERVQALEIEKKDILEKEQHLILQIEQAKKEIEATRQKERELRERLQEAEQKQESPGSKGSKKNSVMQTRSSKVQSFYGKLQQVQLLGNKRDTPTSNLNLSRQASTDIQKHLQQNEEVFTNIIIELQQDRMKLKGSSMMERLNKLSRNEGALNEYIRKQREKKDLSLKLSKDEQMLIENAITNIGTLKDKVKKEMVMQKVIDLTQKRSHNDPLYITQQQQSLPQLGYEKINYLILKAKEEYQDATKVLFSKDSKFHKISSLKDDTIHIQKPITEGESQIKIGSLKLQGLIPNLASSNKRIMQLDSENVRELRRNLAIFSH